MSWYSRPVNLPRYVDRATAVKEGCFYAEKSTDRIVVVMFVGLPCVHSFAGVVSFMGDDDGSLPYHEFVAAFESRPDLDEEVDEHIRRNTYKSHPILVRTLEHATIH